LKIQSSTEVPQQEFRKIYRMNPDAILGYRFDEYKRTITLLNGVQYYTSIFGLGI
jgi:hypothetical protein